MQIPILAVSDFIALTNQTFEHVFTEVAIEGEVASFKVNQGKYVFFDLKDPTGSVGCFMTVWQLRQPIEDGMKVIITATPKLTDWGKFSLTVRVIRPSGEGSLKRSFEILKTKLEKEGLFAEERKRLLPAMPQHIGVISSTGAAGYADFIKILTDRWGGLQIDVAQVQVQGKEAPDQIIRALQYFNTREVLPEIIVIVRGGGSADDLSAFNDELLVREIAASRIPTLVGIGHETDSSLVDLAADVRAATPSNAAQLIVPDKNSYLEHMQYRVQAVLPLLIRSLDEQAERAKDSLIYMLERITRGHTDYVDSLQQKKRLLTELDPKKVLARGYAIIRGEVIVGESIAIEMSTKRIEAEVRHVENRTN